MSSGFRSAITAQTLVERGLAHHSRRTAIVDQHRRLTYGELARRSGRLANALLELGAGRDRPAALWLPNCLEFIEADVACTRAGIVRVAIGNRLSADECSYILRDSQAATLITTATLADQLDAAAVNDLETILLIDGDGGSTAPAKRVHPYEQALALASDVFAAPAVAPASISYLIYTSGTTGRPKGAVHSHAARAAASLNMVASELRHLTRESVFLHTTPLTHGTGAKLLPILAAGATNVVLARFDADRFAESIRLHRATHTFLVPTIIHRLLEAGGEVVETTRSLQQITFGGSPISLTTFRSAVERLGPILVQIYGSSEMPHPVTVLHAEDYLTFDERAFLSAGRPAWGVEVTIADAAGSPVPAGETGELIARAGHMMSGYWRNDAATDEVFTASGYYKSGDLARQDDDGLVTLHDRQRDVVITGGLNVYPSEVERVLSEHAAVRQVAVVGAPDAEWGESVVAYVVADRSQPVSESELIAWVRTRLAGYKKPRRVVFVEELPVSANGKILKRQLRDALWGTRDRRVG